MKVGLFGGSFDPIHKGHISIIEGALKKVDYVVVIPSARNSFKRGRILNPAPYRYYMTVDALENFGNRVIVSDIEFSIEGISYTYLTITKLLTNNYLKNLIGTKEDIELFWICGSDILKSFDKWRNPEDILEKASLLVARRPGEDDTFITDIDRISYLYNTTIRTFKIDGIEAASSSLREDMVQKKVQGIVRDFISTNALYPEVNYLDYCSDEAIEEFYEYAIKLYFILKRKRLLHTLNVAILAVKYAVLHNVNPDKALIAGVLHDCAKELSKEMQSKMSMEYGGPMFDVDKLWHGPAGAKYAQEELGISDKEILDAIMYHTTARSGMTDLDKIIYLADKLEPARTYADLDPIRQATERDLNEGMILCMGEVKKKFDRNNSQMHPFSLACFAELIDNK